MYGFEIINNLGEILISSNQEVYQFSKSFSVNSIEFREGTHVFDVPRDSPDDLHFFELPVGHKIGYGKYTPYSSSGSFYAVRSSLSQINIRVFTPISKIHNPAGSGYGLEVLDGNGDVTFTSSREMLACNSGVIPANGDQVFIGDAEYFSPGMPVLYQFLSGGIYFSVVNLFERPVASKVQQSPLTVNTGPFPSSAFPFASPWPVGALWF